MSSTTFNADDAALAVSMMIEEATFDIPASTSRQEMDNLIDQASSTYGSLIANTVRLHGLTELGDPTEGDEEQAREIISAAKRYQSDPNAYTNELYEELVSQTATAEPETAITEVQAPVETPPVASAPVYAPAPVAQAVSRIRMIPRPAQPLFKGIGASYYNELVPTAHWETPKPEMLSPDDDYLFDGFAVSIMALAIDERKNVMATGDPGTGKTEFFKQFGSRIGLPVHKVPMDGSLTRAEIIGSFRQVATPNGSETPFVLGLIPTLIQQPGIIILDEIDQADPDIMYMLHTALEGNGLMIQEEGGRLIPRHEHCYFVGTANTKGRGSDNGFTHTRFEMSEATRDRFPYWLDFKFMKSEPEADTITAKTGLDRSLSGKMVTVANMIRHAYSNGELSQTCSIRNMLDVAPVARRFASRGAEIGLAIAMEAVMVGRANTEDGLAIREFIKTALAVDLNTVEL